jgi:predicted ester cyclase
MTAQNSRESDLKQAIWNYYDRCWHKADFSVVDEFAEGFEACSNNLWTIDGPEGIKASMSRLVNGISGLTGQIEEWFFQLDVTDADFGTCDRVTIWWRLDGRFTGQMSGIAPTGEPVTISGASLLWLRSGKLIAARACSDIYQQLGSLPKETA